MNDDHKEFDNIEEIVNYLENQYNIHILSIRDYGSRAWNLDSESSDMDAGVLFTQPVKDYVKLGTYRQNIDRKFYLDGEEFEIIAWNIDRWAELLNKSNPSIVEWLNSDIIYYQDEDHLRINGDIVENPSDEDFENPEAVVDQGQLPVHLLEKLYVEANENFKPVALYHHYRSMAEANYRKYIENRNDLRIKRHLYILRGLTYAKYVEEKQQVPPLDFVQFYENELQELGIPDTVYQYLGEFIRQKKNGHGDREIADKELWEWMDNQLEREIDNEELNVNGIDTDLINQFMDEALGENRGR